MPDVFHADALSFDRLVFHPRDELVVVHFFGEHCPNCAVFARDEPRLLERLAHLPVRMVKVDAYRDIELTARFGLHGVPTFLLMRDGERVGKMSFYPGFDEWLTIVKDCVLGGLGR